MKNKGKQFTKFVKHIPSKVKAFFSKVKTFTKNKGHQFTKFVKRIASKIKAFVHKNIMGVVLALTPVPLIAITFIVCLTLSVPATGLIIVLVVVITEFPALFIPFIVSGIKNRKAKPVVAVEGCEKVEIK